MRRRTQHSGSDGPNAIDPRTGFKVKLADLVKDGQTGDLIWNKVADKKHPQDMVRGVPDNMALPVSRPEVPEAFMALNLLWEDDLTPIFTEINTPVLGVGEVVSL